MDKELLLHGTTKNQLDAMIKGRPHAVLIFGDIGAGKETVAQKLISSITGQGTSRHSPYYLEVKPETLSIGIESVREIKDFLSRKTTGSSAIRRIIFIPNAQKMTHEAQNTLLKVLEEPPQDTMIILTAANVLSLKQTIRSRVQQISVLPVDEIPATEYFKSLGYSETDIRTAYFISDGRMGLLTSVLNQDKDHEFIAAINQAKMYLQMKPYERLLDIELLSKQKEQTRHLLKGMERVVSAGLQQAAITNNEVVVKKFYFLRTHVQEALIALDKSTNLKLVLTRLFLKM